MLQIETLMVGSEDTLHTGTVTLTPAPRGDRELDTAQTHDPRCRYSVLYSTLLFSFTLLQSIHISLYYNIFAK